MADKSCVPESLSRKLFVAVSVVITLQVLLLLGLATVAVIQRRAQQCDPLSHVVNADENVDRLRSDAAVTASGIRSVELVHLMKTQCGSTVAVPPVDFAKCDVACLQRIVREKEEELRIRKVRSTLCLTSASPCKIRNADAVRARKAACHARIFDPKVDKFDIVVPWTNNSEASYYDLPGSHFFGSRETLHKPYNNVGSGRAPFSEIVFTLRSLEKSGFMDRVNHVFILYDDDLHGPPQFIRPDQDRVVPLPSSLLAAGTPFVNRRRRLHTTLAYLHHVPAMSDFVFFLPDDCVMLRRSSWSDFFDQRGRVLNRMSADFRSDPHQMSATLAQHFGRSVKLGRDLHAPFMVKKCYLEEIEVEFCNSNVFRCDTDNAELCKFSKFHFQLFAQNYQALREGTSVAESTTQHYSSEIHTNAGRPHSVSAAQYFRDRLSAILQNTNML